MKPLLSLRANLTSLIGVVISAWSAVALCLLFRTRDSRYLVPLAFLAVILVVAMRCGVLAGVLGSLIGALIFALYLYSPIGSVVVESKVAKGNIAWMLLGGLAFSYLLGSSSGGRRSPNR